MILKSLISPWTFLDCVEYSNFSQSVSEYLKNSGILGEKLNVSEVTPEILYWPLYALSTNNISLWFTTSVSDVLMNPPFVIP